MRKNLWLNLSAAALFAVLFCIGMTLARHKPLWNDEVYSQMGTIDALSYAQIFYNRVSDEGNIFPFFYFTQKALCQVLNYQGQPQWVQGNNFWYIHDVRDRLLMRVHPVFFMSLTMTVIFYFFVRFYSWWSGLFSLFLSLSTVLIWGYWAEARPYAPWVFFTAVQMLILMRMTQGPEPRRKLWKWLATAHVLLSTVVVLATPQIAVASAVLWLWGERDWRKYIFLFVIPIALAMSFYSITHKYKFWLDFSFEQVIRAGISRDRLYILYLYIVCLGLYGLQLKGWLPRLCRDDYLLKALPCLTFVLLMIAATGVVYAIFKLRQPADRSIGHYATDRYFINLAPVGIIGTTMLVASMLNAFKDKRWLQVIVFVGTAYLLLYRLGRVIPSIKGYYPELFGGG